MRKGLSIVTCLAAFALSACGGGGVENSSGSESFTISVDVSGLAGTVTLAINGGSTTAISANGFSPLSGALASGATYDVTISAQPAGQTCTVTQGSGIATADVSNVVITCAVTIPSAPVAVLNVLNPKTLTFSWDAVSRATYYRLLKDPDGSSVYTQVGGDIVGTSATDTVAVHLHDWVNARYIVEACNASGCSASSAVSTATAMVKAIGYFKASNTGPSDDFGYSVALSADGTTLAVGARSEHSAATGINGNQADNSAVSGAGAVYVFTRNGATWAQQAYLKASNTGDFEFFGHRLALSADGSTLAVGAPGENSEATGIDGNQSDNSVAHAGAVYVFTRSGTTWSQQAYIKASNTGALDFFGCAVALSADGSTLAVGADSEGSSAVGIDGNQADNSATQSGAVYVFARSGANWSQQAYLKASNTGAYDGFGYSLALSGNGAILAIGAAYEDSSAVGIDGNQADNASDSAGAVYVFTRSGVTWSQQAYVKASNTDSPDSFGWSVALSEDGATMAVGAPNENGTAVGINGGQNARSGYSKGAVYVFTHNGVAWSQQAYIKASNTGSGDLFGVALSLSADGAHLAVAARQESSAAVGVNGNQIDDSALDAGAVYVFTRSGVAWSQHSYLKASNTDSGDYFGSSLALNADGAVLAVGAVDERSAATGVNGTQTDNSMAAAGAVYLF